MTTLPVLGAETGSLEQLGYLVEPNWQQVGDAVSVQKALKDEGKHVTVKL